MSLVVTALAVALLSLPILVSRSRGAPALKVRVACASIVSGMATLLIGLGLAAVPLLVWWHDGPSPTTAEESLRHVSPVGPIGWLLAALLGVVGSALFVKSVARTRRARLRATIPRWALGEPVRVVGGVPVFVAESAEALAFAVPGLAPHVVGTSAISDALTQAEFDAVIRHELAHLRLSHHRYLAVLVCYRRLWGWLPGATAVLADLNFAVEEWADREAISELGADPDALDTARRRLTTSARPLTTQWLSDDGPAGTPTTQILAVGGFGAVLVAAAAYAVTHSFGDVAAVMATVH